jgi:hypothetical protein
VIVSPDAVAIDIRDRRLREIGDARAMVAAVIAAFVGAVHRADRIGRRVRIHDDEQR